jgi:hypothetical protein
LWEGAGEGANMADIKKDDKLDEKLTKKDKQVEKIKEWLTNNKIFFESIAATLLSLMAILVSFLQWQISDKEYKILERKEGIYREADFTKLKNSINEILFSFPPNFARKISVEYSEEQQIEFFERLSKQLDLQAENTFLIENPEALMYWRQASKHIKAYRSYIKPDMPMDKERKDKNLEMFLNSIFQDIFSVLEAIK